MMFAATFIQQPFSTANCCVRTFISTLWVFLSIIILFSLLNPLIQKLLTQHNIHRKNKNPAKLHPVTADIFSPESEESHSLHYEQYEMRVCLYNLFVCKKWPDCIMHNEMHLMIISYDWEMGGEMLLITSTIKCLVVKPTLRRIVLRIIIYEILWVKFGNWINCKIEKNMKILEYNKMQTCFVIFFNTWL